MNRERLLGCIREGRSMHALLFTGPEGSGRTALARDAAAAFLFGGDGADRLARCPDYQELCPPYTVEMIRRMTESMAAQSFSSGRRAFALIGAHAMNASCQNALLKSLEEPPADTLVLLSGNEAALLPTIRSRCAIVRLGAGCVAEAAAELEADGIAPERAALSAAWADGVTGLARSFAADDYASFRADAANCFETALFGGSPFALCASLLRAPAMEPSSKQKQESVNAPLLLAIWQSLARDALLTQLGGAPLHNPDQKKLTARIGACFTTERIQGIITLLGDGRRRLALGASGSLTADAVLAALNEKETT